MKRSVVYDELHEPNLRPQKAYEHYLKILEKEVSERFSKETFVPVPHCPACRVPSPKAIAFRKWNFDYKRCIQCQTLFADPAPKPEALKSFYTDSEALQFWAKNVLTATSQERQDHLFRLRVDWILSFLDTDPKTKKSFVDYGSRDLSFWKEVSRIKTFSPLGSYHALAPGQAVPENSGFKTLSSLPKGGIDVVTMFEVLETTSHPTDLLNEILRSLSDTGTVFITTRAGSGFDMQMLGARSPNLLPPLHLTMLSIEGASQLLESLGFEILELSTPGQLDVEMVLKAIQTDSTLTLPPILDDIIRRRDENVREAFQEFLQTAQLSSHLRIAARRTNAMTRKEKE